MTRIAIGICNKSGPELLQGIRALAECGALAELMTQNGLVVDYFDILIGILAIARERLEIAPQAAGIIIDEPASSA